jgi:hypothetical protein
MLRYETRILDCPTGDDPCETTNERVQLFTDSDNSAGLMDYNVTYYWGFSRYMPSTEYSPTYSDTFWQFSKTPNSEGGHAVYFTYRPQSPGDTTATAYRARCEYWTAGPTKNTCTTTTTGVGYKNPIDAYTDEWADILIEVKFHDTDGVYKVWTRRPEVTNDYTLQVDYSGPLGWLDDTRQYRLEVQLYGGGGFPLVLYYDEIKMTNAATGSITDVQPPTLQ